MIDNLEQAIELMEEMKASLPIPARPTPELRQTLSGRSGDLPPEAEWEIESVFYLGDEGGIACGLRTAQSSKAAVVVSLTQLRVAYSHPLARRIRDYQSKRVKKLARQNPSPGARAGNPTQRNTGSRRG